MTAVDSLNDRLRGELERIVAVPSRTEVLARIASRSAPELLLNQRLARAFPQTALVPERTAG